MQIYLKITGRIVQIPNPFFRFPGGEIHMKNRGVEWAGEYIFYVTSMDLIEQQMFQIHLWAQAVYDQGGTATVIMPYLPAARSDNGVPMGAETYTALLRASKVSKVICVDPHSDVIIKLLERDGVEVDAIKPSAFAEEITNGVTEYTAVIAPDAGAYWRAKGVADKLGITLFSAAKVRNQETGRILEYTTPSEAKNHDSILVVDDICDGGATFNLLAEGVGHKSRLDLYVTHGIFSQGTDLLLEKYNKIITTNSYRDYYGKGVDKIDIKNMLLARV